ncbi:hypothetical protein BT96DRAFT_1026948 [Gymnopus androsaceus JB14]|uniref:Uncharacterized protein n=1 Tax=Gymnopus androsaceus JB14 TaxID=1447944 RepID=A0A6A4GFJ6_9AGAR|nr:hypothetical protein BT96DRAFT_1026948 [Gymnopus androsaceus JB14]
MTPEEAEQIASAGLYQFRNVYVLIFIWSLIGVYLVAFAIGMHIIIHKENRHRAHAIVIIFLLTAFVFTFMFACQETVASLINLKFGPIMSPGDIEASGPQSAFIVASILSSWSGNVTFCIADAFIVWRAWSVWLESRVIKFTLIILLTIDIAINIADGIADTQADKATGPVSTVALDWAIIVTNLGVNIVATLFIAYRAWIHHKSIGMISRTHKTQVEEILLLFVESGAIFAVVQILTIIISILDAKVPFFSPVDDADVLILVLYQYAAAINPVALIILIQTGNTYEQSLHLPDELPSIAETEADLIQVVIE